MLVIINGENYVFSARKEVILSAGVFQSPRLLMASGVGPKDTLQECDIPLIANLSRVGQNVGTRVLFSIAYRVETITNSRLRHDPRLLLKHSLTTTSTKSVLSLVLAISLFVDTQIVPGQSLIRN